MPEPLVSEDEKWEGAAHYVATWSMWTLDWARQQLQELRTLGYEMATAVEIMMAASEWTKAQRGGKTEKMLKRLLRQTVRDVRRGRRPR